MGQCNFLHLWHQKLYRAFRFGTLWPISCSYPRHSQLTRHSLMVANGRIRQSLTALVAPFETHISDWYLNYLSVNPHPLPLLHGTGPLWWLVNIGSGNGLVLSDYKPLPELMLTKFYDLTAYGVTRPQWVNYPSWTGRPTEPHCFRATHFKVVTLWDTFLHHCTNKRPQPPIFSQTGPYFLVVPLKYYSTMK